MTDTSVEDTSSIGRKAATGIGWGLLGNVGVKIISFATALSLARLLAPDDFGAYAVALAATQLVIHINDLGLIPAVIQWRGRTEEVAATASTIAAVSAACCTPDSGSPHRLSPLWRAYPTPLRSCGCSL